MKKKKYSDRDENGESAKDTANVFGDAGHVPRRYVKASKLTTSDWLRVDRRDPRLMRDTSELSPCE